MIKGGCRDPECGVSTGFCDRLTFGKGRLDDEGYWAKPCFDCARAWEALHPEDAPCWPFPSGT